MSTDITIIENTNIESINNALDQLREQPAKPRKMIGYKQNNELPGWKV